MEDLKPSENLTSNGESLRTLVCCREVELSSETPSNHFFPIKTMHDRVNISKYESDYSPKTVLQSDLNDKTAPFESLKEAVSVDLRAHRIQIVERQKLVDEELEKSREEVPEHKRWSEAAEEEKMKLFEELDSTKRLIAELKLNLEMAQTEETQAKQDSELAMLRLDELEQGIADDASVAAKAQLEVAEARHEAAVSELKSMKAEMKTLRKEYDSLAREKDVVVGKLNVAMAASKEAEMTVEELTFELIAAKEELESSQTYHLEAEEKRRGATMAREQDSVKWEMELKEAHEEIQKLNPQVISAKDLRSKLNSASTLLLDLRNELDSYLELKSNEKLEEEPDEMEAAIALTKKELVEEKVNIEKAITKVNCFKIAAISLSSELETEKSALCAIRLREEMASIAVSALETEVENTLLELALVQMKEREARERKSELPKLLQLLATKAEQAKSFAQTAREEMQNAKQEAEQAKAAARTIESRLIAVQKEIEASKASKRLALEAIKALRESESGSPNEVTLSFKDYHELSKFALEAEELAYTRVSSSISQMKIAKETESKSWAELEEVNRDTTAIKKAVKIAKEKAEKAKEGELRVEQELRKWRVEQERMRKANECHRKAIKCPGKKDSTKLDKGYFPASHVVSPELHFCALIGRKGSSSEAMMGKRTRKCFFPRILVHLARRKQH